MQFRVMVWALWGLTLGAAGCTRAGQSSDRDAGASEAARWVEPVRPEGLRTVGFVFDPRESMGALNTMLHTRLSPELGLTLSLGVPLPITAAVDLGRPVTVAAVRHGAHEGLVFSMVPQRAGAARSALQSRYRLVLVPGLGERIEARDVDAGARDALACALVVTRDAVGARVVCASTEGLLAHAGRWLASSPVPDSAGDAVRFSFDHAALGALAVEGRQQLRGLRRALDASLARARREHLEAPTYGDPESLLDFAHALGTGALDGLADAEGLDLAFRLDGRGVSLDARARDGAAQAAVARPDGGVSETGFEALRLRSFLGAQGPHSLARLVPADAALTLATRTDPASARTLWNTLTALAVDTLGRRLSAAPAATRDLTALGAHTDGALVAAVVPGLRREGPTVLVFFSQDDAGQSARACVRALAGRPWLRGAQLGTPLDVVARGDGLRVTARATPETAAAPSTETAPRSERGAAHSLDLAVLGGALVVAWGPASGSALAGLAGPASHDRLEREGAASGSMVVEAFPRAALGLGGAGRSETDALRVDAWRDGAATRRLTIRLPAEVFSLAGAFLGGGRREGVDSD
ncbi:MAG: hypothetical protein JNK72_16100 [Myxococcales bacterium]|nr:hypothetical protein [Myxococcales bacterium]